MALSRIQDVHDDLIDKEIFYLSLKGSVQSIDVTDDYAFIACGSKGLAIVNIADPTNPRSVLYVGLSGFARDISVCRDFAYLIVDDVGLAIIDVQNPLNPKNIIYLSITEAISVQTVDNGIIQYALISRGEKGVEVINVTSPANPFSIKNADTSGNAYSAVSIDGKYVFVADGHYGLAVFNVSYRGKWFLYQRARESVLDIDVQSNYVYQAINNTGLGITRFYSTAFITSSPIYQKVEGEIGTICVVNDFAILSLGNLGVGRINISDPMNPGEPVYFKIDGFAQDVTSTNDWAFISLGEAGLATLNISRTFEDYSSVVSSDTDPEITSGFEIFIVLALISLTILKRKKSTK